MGKKLTNLNRYISVVTNIDEKWFVVFEHTMNHLSFGYVHLPQFESIYFWTAKRTVFKVWAIEDIREDFCATEIGGTRLGDPSQ